MNGPKQTKLRLKDKRRRLVWVKVAAGASVVALSFAFALYGLNRPEVNVQSIAVLGTSLTNPELIKKIVSAEIERPYLYIIPRTNVFLLPYESIETTIESTFPQVAAVVLAQSSQELTVEVSERVAVALWCKDQADTSNPTTDNCFLMDENGYVFDKGYVEGLIRYRGRIEENPVGKKYLDGTFKNFATQIDELEKATKRTIVTATVNEHDDVTATFKEGGEIIFRLSPEYQELMDNVSSVFSSSRFSSGERLEYADFRFGNKVYVKFEGE